MFPATIPMLDTFGGPDGPLSSSWIDALGVSGLTLSGGVATGTSGGGRASAWKFPMASAVAAYCRVSALPTTFVVKIVLTPDPVGGTPQIVASYGQTGQLAISSSPGGGNGLSTPLNPGDWIGVSFDGTLIKGWTAVGGAGFTTSLSLATPGGFPAPSGFYAILQIIDTVASVSAFGAQLLPGADITAPIEHGHGAC